MGKQLLRTRVSLRSILQKCFLGILLMVGQLLMAYTSAMSTRNYLSLRALCLKHKPDVI